MNWWKMSNNKELKKFVEKVAALRWREITEGTTDDEQGDALETKIDNLASEARRLVEK